MALSASDAARLLYEFAEQTREHAVILVDLEGRIAWWGDGAAHIFGYGAGEVLGGDVARLFTPEEAEKGVPEYERGVAARNDSAEDDRWMVRSDGSRFFATGVMSSIRRDGEVVAFAKMLRDRTDLREQLQEMRNRVADAESAGQRKDVFLATLSHELRNPLAPLANAVALIRMSVASTPELEYAVKVIERQTQILRRLVDDLLDVSRVGAGKVDLRREGVDLREIARQAVESVQARLRQGGLECEVFLQEGPVTTWGDRDRLHQVLVNLLTNAVKYTPAGGRIWVKVATEADEAVLRVEDTGVGIAPDMLPRIFELFTQVEESRPLAGGGLGIGLALVKSLVTMHGGSVQVRSDGPGKGSLFVVRLPVDDPNARDATPQAQAPRSPGG